MLLAIYSALCHLTRRFNLCTVHKRRSYGVCKICIFTERGGGGVRNKIDALIGIYSVPPPPTLVRLYFLRPPGTRAIFFHSNVLYNNI